MTRRAQAKGPLAAAAPAMLSASPRMAATAVSPSVTPVPSTNKLRYWSSAPKSSSYPMSFDFAQDEGRCGRNWRVTLILSAARQGVVEGYGPTLTRLKVARQRQHQPFLRDVVEAAVLLDLRHDLVDLGLEPRLVLIEGDVVGRVHQLELLLGLDRRVLRQDRGADIVADHHELYLARQEGRDDAVIVAEALDIGARRGDLGDRGVLERPAIDGDRLALEVGGPCHGDGFRPEHRDVVRPVGVGEIDDLFALRALAATEQ